MAKSSFFFLTAFLFFLYLAGISISFPFQYDDFPNIVFNRSLRYLGDWQLMLQSAPQKQRLITNLSLSVNFLFSGLNPASYRIWNYVLLFLISIVSCLLSRRVFKMSWYLSFMAGTLILLHPISWESSVYLSGRSGLLVLFFSLLSLLIYAENPRTALGRNLQAIGFNLFAFFAFFSKESAIILPLLAITLGLYQRRSWKRISLEVAPFFVFAGGLVLFKFSYLKLLFSGDLFQQSNLNIDGIGAALLLQLSLWPKLLGFFFTNHFFAIEHSIRQVSYVNAFLGLALVLSLVSFTLWTAQRRNILPILFLVSLLPTNSIVLLPDPLAERHAFMALPWACIAVVAYLGTLKWDNLKSLISIAIGIYLSLQSWERIELWQNPSALWSDASIKYPQSAKAAFNAALTKLETDHEGKRSAMEAQEVLLTFWNNFNGGDWEEVEALVDLSAQLKYEHPEMFEKINRSDFTYKFVEIAYLLRTNNAALALEKNLALEKENPKYQDYVRALLGRTYFEQKEFGKAIEVWKQIVGKENFDSINAQIGRAYFDLGDYGNADAYWNNLMAIDLKKKRIRLEIVVDYVNLLISIQQESRARVFLAKALELYIDNLELRKLEAKLNGQELSPVWVKRNEEATSWREEIRGS